MSLKKWQLRETNEARTKEIMSRFGLERFLAEIIAARGLDDAKIVDFFGEQELESPFVLKDMEKAVQRVSDAMEQGECVAVYGDYDSDGVTSTLILTTYLTSMGLEVIPYLPEWGGEGYGLNCKALSRLKEQGATLIITVDNGISAMDEALYAAEIGLDLIVTDHHQPGEELPKAVAVINPHRKDCPSRYKDLAGVGVAFKLITALEGGDYDSTLNYFGDFVAIGTVGDIVPLTGENRRLVQFGLKMLAYSENVGLHALMEEAKIKKESITSIGIAFGIVPRINAAGRFSQARKALELFLCEDPAVAGELAREINGLNAKRQQEEQDIIRQVDETIADSPEKLYNRVVVLAGSHWNHGIVGIVSARLIERYGKPNVLLCVEENEARGSARSVEGFSIYDAFDANRALCTKMGGHSLAAGLTLPPDQIEAFDKGLNAYARLKFDEMPLLTHTIDKTLSLSDLTLENVKQMDLLEPFGAQNPSPLFLMHGMTLMEVTPLSGGKHLRLTLSSPGGKPVTALYFGMTPARFVYSKGSLVDLLVTLDVNSYNGNTSVSVKLKDIRPADFAQEKYFSAQNAFEHIMRDESVDPRLKPRIVPTRDEFAFVYKFLRSKGTFEGGSDALYTALLKTKINYCKLRVLLCVMEELGLIEMPPSQEWIKVLTVNQKVDIGSSKLLQKLQGV